VLLRRSLVVPRLFKEVLKEALRSWFLGSESLDSL